MIRNTNNGVNMSLEQAIADNTAAIRELIQAIKLLSTTSVTLKDVQITDVAKPREIVTYGELTTKVIPDTPPAEASVEAPVELDFTKDVIPVLQQLAKKPATGHQQLQELLAEFGCKGKTVPALKPLGRNAEIVASARRRLEG